MASDERRAGQEERLTYSALSGTFVAIFAVVDRLTRRGQSKLGPFDLALLGLSAYRLGRMVSYDVVMEPVRSPFTDTVPDPTGAGDTVAPKGTGWRRAVGELLSCPICTGTWIAAGLVYGLELAPRATRRLLSVMGTIGLAELLNALTEWLGWGGRRAREEAGSQARAKAKGSRAPSL